MAIKIVEGDDRRGVEQEVNELCKTHKVFATQSHVTLGADNRFWYTMVCFYHPNVQS